MSKFKNKATGVTFSVSDDKDERYERDGYEAAEKKAPAKKAAPSKPSK